MGLQPVGLLGWQPWLTALKSKRDFNEPLTMRRS